MERQKEEERGKAGVCVCVCGKENIYHGQNGIALSLHGALSYQ